MNKVFLNKELMKELFQLIAYYMLLGTVGRILAPAVKASGPFTLIFFSTTLFLLMFTVVLYSVIHVLPNATNIKSDRVVEFCKNKFKHPKNDNRPFNKLEILKLFFLATISATLCVMFVKISITY